MARAALTPQAMPAFAEAPDERARMGRISGVLWTVAALVAIVDCFLPGARHVGTGWVLALSGIVLAYGVGSGTGWIPWDRASVRALGIGMAVTIPVVGVAIWFSGGALSYVEPMLVGSLLYAAFFFPAHWAWPLSIELIVCAGTPLLYDGNAIEVAYLPRYLGLASSFLVATWVMVGLKKRLVDAEVRQRDFANRDPLTGVGNRRCFDATLQRELARRTEVPGRHNVDPTPLALLVLDVNDFKGVNDEHGHPVGDAVLCRVAERAEAAIGAGDILSRIGGDEFGVIAPGARKEDAWALAEAIGAAVAEPEPGSTRPAPSASIGWAVFPEDGQDFGSLMRAADERMLERKRERVAVY